MKITNKLGLPQALVDAVTREYQYKEDRYSATSILKPVRELMLLRRHDNEIEQDVAEMMWLIFGTAVHSIIQNSKSGNGQFKEERIEIPVGKYTLSGIIDLYDIDKEIVSDWKTASVFKYKSGDWEDYKKQLMIYAYMLKHHGFGVKKVQIVPMYKDYRKSEALKGDYPEMPIGLVEFDVTDEEMEKIESLIKDNFAKINICEYIPDDELPLCTPEERWATEDKWAVMKKGVKKAVKLHDSCDSAQTQVNELGAGYYVEQRKGIDKKCTEYCACRHFCSYWKTKYAINNTEK